MRCVPQQWLVLMQEAVERGIGGELEFGIGTDDHGIRAAQFQRAGDEVAAAGFTHLAAGRHAAGEGDFLHAGIEDVGTGLAIAIQYM